MPTTSPYLSRIARLRALLPEHNLDALVVRNRVNIKYLCGFNGSYGHLLVDRRKALLITDARYGEIAEGVLDGTKVKLEVQPSAKVDDWFTRRYRKAAFQRLGFEGSVTYDEFEKLGQHVADAKTELTKAPALVEQLRAVKDEAELAAIQRAARVADKMMARAYEALEPGRTELEVSAAISAAAHEFGATGESFSNIVASGPNASRPHHSPAKRKLKKGDMVTLDLGAVVDGYCSDLTRNPTVGPASAQYRDIYDICLAANEAAIAACRAGLTGAEVDHAARQIIVDAGHGDHFGHGTGHGVGMEIHESPRLRPDSDHVLEPGNVVTIEPGIYVPGFGGVRIEDLVVVTQKGCRVLSRAPKTLAEVGAAR